MCQERRAPPVFRSVKKLVTTLAIGSLLVFPATALAGNGGHHSVPPGNSGLDQYTENIPGAGGNHPTGGGGSHHPGGGGCGSRFAGTPGLAPHPGFGGPAATRRSERADRICSRRGRKRSRRPRRQER